MILCDILSMNLKYYGKSIIYHRRDLQKYQAHLYPTIKNTQATINQSRCFYWKILLKEGEINKGANDGTENNHEGNSDGK